MMRYRGFTQGLTMFSAELQIEQLQHFREDEGVHAAF